MHYGKTIFGIVSLFFFCDYYFFKIDDDAVKNLFVAVNFDAINNFYYWR